MTGTVARIVQIKKVDAERHDGEGLRRGRNTEHPEAVLGVQECQSTARRTTLSNDRAEEPTFAMVSWPRESSGREADEKQNPVGLEAIRPVAATGHLEQRI